MSLMGSEVMRLRKSVRKNLIRLKAADLKDRDLPGHVQSSGWKYFPRHVDEFGNDVPPTFHCHFDTHVTSRRSILSRHLGKMPLLAGVRRNLAARSVLAMYSLAECLEEKARELREWCWEKERKRCRSTARSR